MAESHEDPVVVYTAKSAFDAKVVAGVLRGAGIPCYAGTMMLNDEFAVSQALMNQLNVELKVPADRVDDAKRALAESEDSAKLLEDPDFDPNVGGGGGDDGGGDTGDS